MMATSELNACAAPDRSARWLAVGSMTMCVALRIASEFMPVSLLTPIAHDLGATEGQAGQAISVSGLFAVVTSLFIATLTGRIDRRQVLMALTATMALLMFAWGALNAAMPGGLAPLAQPSHGRRARSRRRPDGGSHPGGHPAGGGPGRPANGRRMQES